MGRQAIVKVRLVGVLKSLALGREEVELILDKEEVSVRELIRELKKISDKLFKRIFDESRQDLVPDIYVAVNDVDIRLLMGLDTKVKGGDVVLVLAYIHGG